MTASGHGVPGLAGSIDAFRQAINVMSEFSQSLQQTSAFCVAPAKKE